MIDSTMIAAPALPMLTIPHANVRQALRERIEMAKSLISRPLRSEEELENAKEREREWKNYNRLLLKRLFTSPEFVSEYDLNQMRMRRAEDRYMSPSIEALGARLTGSISRQVATLESIIKRVELLDVTLPSGPLVSRGGDLTKVFVVYGHDDAAREMVARFIEKLGLKAILLQEQTNQGRTVIEKIEAHGDVGFAVVLLTPDDEGCAKGGTPEPRARQNVLLELGYFFGRLGREKVCTLKRGHVEIPSDFAGVVWETMDSGNGWKQTLGRELKTAGYVIDWNKVMA